MNHPKELQTFLRDVHKLDTYVMGPTTLIKFDEHAKGTTGFFANTQAELYRKMAQGESAIEKLYDILDGGELYRYVSSRNYKCYAIFMPSQLFNLLQGDINEQRN